MRLHEFLSQLAAFPPNTEILVVPKGQPGLQAEVLRVVNDHGRAVVVMDRLIPDWVDENEVVLLREKGQIRCQPALH